MKKRRVGIYGAGGHAREIAWLVSSSEEVNGLELIGFIDDSSNRLEALNDYQVLALGDFCLQNPESLVAIGIGDPAVRRRIAEKCSRLGIECASLTHRSVEVSDYVERGNGCIICAGSVLTVNITLGVHVHINVGCTISHDVKIGDFTTLSPGVHVAGNVRIAENVFVGTGVSIINGTPDVPLVIGSGAVIGAGSCVTGSLDANGLYVGVPAKLKKKFL